MDEELPRLPDAPEPAADADPAPTSPPLPDLPEEIASGDEELRRLIAAGASTPEELRDLAARIREHRAREEAVWREEMRPALKKAKKGRVRIGDLVDRPDEPKVANGLMYGLGLAGIVLVLVLAATQSSVIWALLPLVAVLGYAYWVGRRDEPSGEGPPEPGPSD
jgi:hypothetical protein